MSHGRSRVPTTPVCRGCCFPRLPGRTPWRTAASVHAPRRRAAPCAPGPPRSSGHAVLSKRKPGTRSADPRRPGSARAPQRRGCPVGSPAPQAHVVQLRATAAAGTRLPPDHVPRHPLAGAPSRAHAAPGVQDPGESRLQVRARVEVLGSHRLVELFFSGWVVDKLLSLNLMILDY